MIETLKQTVTKQALTAALAARQLVAVSTDIKNKALEAMAHVLLENSEEILFRNEIDVEAAKESDLSSALIDRLTLNQSRIASMAQSVHEIARLKDPIGDIVYEQTIAGGARLQHIRVPLGVISIIYESRPNVTIESIALCLKAGNAVILRGGREAVNSNMQLVHAVTPALINAGVPEGAIQFISSTDRQAIHELTQLDTMIDLVIARGSEEMINAVRKESKVAVLGHGKGLCHTYIDASAQKQMAIDIAFNAKVQRPGVCNAMETLLVHKDAAQTILPDLGKKLIDAGVEIRGCERTRSILREAKAATEDDWATEYLDKILSVKIVDSVEEAINHIAKYGSKHSEAIITDDQKTAEKFLTLVDAAAVFHNASTRLHDGGVFGLGAEIGISTQKLHARGAMGLKELTTTKFVIRGSGQVRQ